MIVLHVYDSIELEQTLIKSADDTNPRQHLDDPISLLEGIDIEFYINSSCLSK